MVHIGHLKYFQEAKDLGNILIVSVTSDRYVKKGYNKPYFNDKYFMIEKSNKIIYIMKSSIGGYLMLNIINFINYIYLETNIKE